MYDVIIIGGGPAGSTCASLLKKYRPSLNVLILEKEQFPREHVGESQLPPVCMILHEMGAWDKVEAANFPVKIGATYRWGNTDDLWDFQFLTLDTYDELTRPGTYDGIRQRTAFQVERSVYDKILLDHAREFGTEVRESTAVEKILVEGGEIKGVQLPDGTVETARYYVDASGTVGLMRRALGVEVDEPTNLRNVAFWDYWNNTEWAITVGAGGTRVQIMSLGFGWLWFIPIAPTRTSIGLVCPAEYYKSCGKSKEELYHLAIQSEPRIASLVKNATPDGTVRGTKDWSFCASQMHGSNWFIIGEAAGFADPILSAGLTMAHQSARELAYTIVAIEEGKQDAEWLKEQVTENQTRRIKQHIKFADYWYTGNGCFTDVKEHTRTIAAEVGLNLDANAAFQWLGTGGFIESELAGMSGFDLQSVIATVEMISDGEPNLEVFKYNRYRLDMDGATTEKYALYGRGEIIEAMRWRRGNATLPNRGIFAELVNLMQRSPDATFVLPNAIGFVMRNGIRANDREAAALILSHIESMLSAGWVKGEIAPELPNIGFRLPKDQRAIRKNTDTFLEFANKESQ